MHRIIFISAFVALAFGVIVSPGAAQEKSGRKPGFVLKQGNAKIVLIRPSIKVGAQSTGGLFEPNADWTAQARENIAARLHDLEAQLGAQIVEAEEPVGEEAQVLADYRALFSVLAESVIQYQFFPGNRLPTKMHRGVFDWTMGPGVAALAKSTGADYALFISTEDQFGSTGRKLFQLFAAMAYVTVKSGEHKGFAGLVDLRTGDLVWLNADLEMGGDVRTPEGARKRVAELLKNFPSSVALPVSAVK
jgi:hypothetical protein